MTDQASGTTTVTVHVTGMTCRACENRVSKALRAVPGVVDARASSMSGNVILTVTEPPAPEAVEAAVTRAGYAVGSPPLLSHDRTVWLTALAAAVAVGLLIALAAGLGLGELAGSVGGPGDGGLLVVLLVGLTAGVSTCMALVGGVVLALSSSREVPEDASRLQVMRPHLAFQIGRIAGFFVLGAALGALGARLAVPTGVQAALMIAVAVVMLVLGLRLTGISPRAAGWSPTLPAGLARRLGLAERAERPYSDARAAGLGALTFFLPCGFTQAVQIYALATANPLTAGLVMAVFAIGTAPGLLALAGLPGLATGTRRPRVLAVVGVLLVAFALVNVSAAVTLAGWTPSWGSSTPTAITSNVTVADGVQTVTMEQGSRGYTPADSVVYAGLPIRWVITSESSFSCAAYLRDGSGWRVDLATGVNTIERPAMAPGRWDFSCVMGMYSGSITAIEPPPPASG
jgi:sulfite exporter TauE/SafE/copper chaperone CopZ